MTERANADRHERRYQLRVKRHLVWNYLVHSIEGGLCIGGMAFVSGQTIAPKMVESLGGPSWLVGLMPILLLVGFMAPQLFVAHRIERMARHKPLVVFTSIPQRLPYLFAGLVLVYWADDYPGLALAAAALCPLVSGLTAGTMGTA